MPSKQSPEIDYNGNEVWKYIETSLNPEKIICEGLQESSRIIGCKNFPGYLQLKLKSIDNKNLTLNVFIRKITYDISHKDSIR